MFEASHRASHAKPWNADDIEQMAELIFLGRSIPEMARLLGRTQEAVRTKAYALDFLPKRASRPVLPSIEPSARSSVPVS